MTQLQNSVILLTGAAGGFGQQFTRQLLKAGSHLILTDIDKQILQEKAATIQQEITTGKILACLEMDLSTRQGSQALYDTVKALNISVDIVINNAGIGLYSRMDEVPLQKWETLMQVNLLAPMHLTSLFMGDMIARQQGHIVNMSSLAGHIVPGGMAHYGASKFGLRGFTEGLFNEVKQHNIQVTGVYPFFSRTAILQSEQYGTLGQKTARVPDKIVTDPAKVIERTIQGIVRNQLHVFPDRIAQFLYVMKRYFPSLVNWASEKIKPKQ